MGWPFLMVVRDEYKSENNWGRMYIRSFNGKRWELLSYSYELPWKENRYGRSRKNRSRIKLGTYDMTVRRDGSKGWRLQLKGTGHRTYIQIHRAHRTMKLAGCILPVHFNDFDEANLKKGDRAIQTQSVKLMEQIRARYDRLKKAADRPTVTIAAKLPARIDTGTAFA